MMQVGRFQKFCRFFGGRGSFGPFLRGPTGAHEQEREKLNVPLRMGFGNNKGVETTSFYSRKKGKPPKGRERNTPSKSKHVRKGQRGNKPTKQREENIYTPSLCGGETLRISRWYS